MKDNVTCNECITQRVNKNVSKLQLMLKYLWGKKHLGDLRVDGTLIFKIVISNTDYKDLKKTGQVQDTVKCMDI